MPVSQRPNSVPDKKSDRSPYGSADVDDRVSEVASPLVLAGLIEGQIIPRLLVAYRTQSTLPAEPARDRISAVQAEGFAATALRLEAHSLMEQVDGFIARGASVEAVLIDLLAPAARQIGVWWEEDACDFVDVTMGLWRLQQVVYEISARIPGKAPIIGRSRRGLFSVVPGASHSLGTVMVEECFRREGWMTTLLTSATDKQIIKLIDDQHFDIMGLTISRESEIPYASDLIARVRTRSKNPFISVLVGGRVLTDSPELALQLGADATAFDAQQGVARAELLLQTLDEQVANRS
jgi:MerR family transcriptional regulator, light-induced transcriptional regulator